MVVTFVTSSNLKECAQVLDNKRLGKQRVEAKQILDIIEGKSGGFAHHPIVEMWRCYPDALKLYINAMIDEWVERGFKNTMEKYDVDDVKYPWWFNWKYLHLSHKCSLMRKNPDHYKSIFVLSETEKVYLQHGYIWVSKLSHEIIVRAKNGSKFSPEEICSPIGAGAPAQYRWTKEEVEKWILNKNVNPKTGKKINPESKSGIAADIRKAAKYYKLDK